MVSQKPTKIVQPTEAITSLQPITLYDYSNELQALTNMVTCNNGVLNFSSSVDVAFIIDEIERIQKDWNNSFENNFPISITAEELDDMDEKYNFDEEQPLKDFENAFACFQSLRKRIDNEEETWLANSSSDLDINTDPTDNYVSTDEITQTVLNENSEISIDNQLNDLSSLYDPSNDLVSEVIRENTCKPNDRIKKKFTPPAETDRKIFAILSIQGNLPWGGQVDVKTKSYKKKGNRFKKSRANIYAEVNGLSKVKTANCELKGYLTIAEESKKRRKVKPKKNRWWGSIIKIKKYTDPNLYDLIGFHGINGVYWNTKL